MKTRSHTKLEKFRVLNLVLNLPEEIQNEIFIYLKDFKDIILNKKDWKNYLNFEKYMEAISFKYSGNYKLIKYKIWLKNNKYDL